MTCEACGRVFDNVKAYAGHRRAHPEPCPSLGAYNRGCRCEGCRAVKYSRIVEWRTRHPGYNAERQRLERARAAALRGPRAVPGCGTASGWHRHNRAGESPCRACVAAVNAYNRRRAAIRRRRARRGPWWCVVCDVLEARGPLTAAVLVELVGDRHEDVRPATVRTDLARLRKAGVVEYDGDRWRVVDHDWPERVTL